MEKKDERLTQKNQDTEPNEHLTSEDHGQGHMNYAKKNPKTGSPLHDIVSPVTQQYPPTLQWLYTPQMTLEHPVGRCTFNFQQSSPVDANQKQVPFLNPQQQQQNPVNNQTQIGQSQVNPGAGAFWLPRTGLHAASTSHQPITPIVAPDSNWQAPVVVGGASSGPEPMSTYCYQSGYSYPLGFPGVYGFFGVPPPMFDSSLSGQPHQRGIIPLATKLSQKHQQMWEAQSAENVHLRTALSRMEAEIAAHRSRLMWLEAEVSSLKAHRDSVMEGSVGAATVLSVQTSKRGRPKRAIASSSTAVLPFSDDLQPKARRRKTTLSCKVEPETKGLNSNKESLKQEEDGMKPTNQMLGIGTISIQAKDDIKISTCIDGSVSETDGSKLKLSTDIPSQSTLQNLAHLSPVIQISGSRRNCSLESKASGKEENRKTAFSIPTQPAKETNSKGTSALQTQMWNSNTLSNDCRRNMLDIRRSHAFYDDTNIVRHGAKVFSGWSFVNEDASEEHEDLMGSGKDEGEMEEDTSSAADEMSQAKAEDNLGTGPSTMISKGLPQMNRW
ncbi:pollen-specific leucine-rich repeat extensin-like protein 2 isoform X1 [Cinnamomum micranthum f. kanehirae]|uniref:Pollen-specific leucine-rich repeat extensin-like protein 2 isoform X1 n=1 Tax=Cinnamomum micranthum f. kanehirae TaxID=337451 RepID=A0A3S3MQL8_9MAGN|nr:pollen-specific leucine-rich repeat extensin-like protein 2 isoform X1 [Cinnamomum micranthum f. kanehirae]